MPIFYGECVEKFLLKCDLGTDECRSLWYDKHIKKHITAKEIERYGSSEIDDKRI